MDGEETMVRCFVEDELLLEFMQNMAMLPSKLLALIASEAPVDALPRFCELYMCVHKDVIWSPKTFTIDRSSTTLVKACVDYLLAGNAQTLYGEIFSRFFTEHCRRYGRLCCQCLLHRWPYVTLQTYVTQDISGRIHRLC